MSEWWRQFLDAFLRRGVYDPSGRDQKIGDMRSKLRDENAAHRETLRDAREYARRSVLVDLDDEEPGCGDEKRKALKFSVALIRLHFHVYGTWPHPSDVQRALDALHVPNNGPLPEQEET